VTEDSHKFSKEEDDTPLTHLPSEIALTTKSTTPYNPLLRQSIQSNSFDLHSNMLEGHTMPHDQVVRPLLCVLDHSDAHMLNYTLVRMLACLTPPFAFPFPLITNQSNTSTSLLALIPCTLMAQNTSILIQHISGHLPIIDFVFIPSPIVISIPPLSTFLIFSHSHCLSL
jgi:hypothetical protein